MFFRNKKTSGDHNISPESRSSYAVKEAGDMLKKGAGKQEVAAAFQDRLDRDVLGRLLASYPDRCLYRKYRFLNALLVLSLGAGTVVKFLNLLYYIDQRGLSYLHILWAAPLGLIIYLMLIYFAVKKIGISYRFFGVFVFLTSLASLDLRRGIGSTEDLIYLATSAGLSLITTFLFLFLGYRMFPYLGFFKVKRDDQGRIIFTSESAVKGSDPESPPVSASKSG